MILTAEELDVITELFYAQRLPSSFPSPDECDFMDIIADEMTLDQYLWLPPPEKAKWWINYNPEIKMMELDDGTIFAPFYFEPVTRDIQERVY